MFLSEWNSPERFPDKKVGRGRMEGEGREGGEGEGKKEREEGGGGGPLYSIPSGREREIERIERESDRIFYD